MVSHDITQRAGEIGLRMALGASRSSILNLALGETARLPGSGVLFGIGLALAAIALLAGLMPALRTARVDPMTALRYE